MSRPRITVLGGSVAGSAAALLLARAGRPVTLVERDPLPGSAATTVARQPRAGVPHYEQPHAVIPRGRAELLDLLPDVYGMLREAGGRDVDLRTKLPGETRPEDGDLQYLAVRRPLIESALHRALRAEPLVELRDGERVSGLRCAGGRVTELSIGAASLDTDLLVDASGRRTAVPDWLAAAASSDPAPRHRYRGTDTPCGVVYYSRYYRTQPGAALPDGPWLVSPRGDLGYFGYATFPGDAIGDGCVTFAVVLAVPPAAAEWKLLADPAAFEAAVAAIGGLRGWVDPDIVQPITDVMPMAGLHNRAPAPVPAGTAVAPVGDALAHTDPSLAHGLAFALVHARALRDAVLAEDDPCDAVAAYRAAVDPLAVERFDFASAVDAQRLRMWAGERVDVAHAHGDYELFSMVAAGAVALYDADVFRAFVRRIGLLDSVRVFDADIDLQARVEREFAELRATPRPAPGPPRDDMVALLRDAVARRQSRAG